MARSSALAAVIVLSVSAGTAFSQPQELVDKFERRSYTLHGFTLSYRLFVPEEYDSTIAYPLVLALHGSGERGDDNEKHIANHRMATAWADPVAQARHPAFVFAPQAPGGGDWGNPPESPMRPELATTFAILDSLAIEFNVDPDRIYITGLSMGGFGTFEAVGRTEDRDLFAAAIPMSGGGLPYLAYTMEDVPFWILHGESDDQVDPQESRDMVSALEELGRDALYTHCGPFQTCRQLSEEELDVAFAAHPNLIYTGLPGAGHVIWPAWYDNPRLQDWLFAQHRLVADGIQFEKPEQLEGNPDVVGMEWATTTPHDSVEVWFRPQPDAAWQFVDRIGNEMAYELPVGGLPDLPLAQTRLFLIDSDGLVNARAESERFVVNADGDGAPYVLVRDFPFRAGTPFTEAQMELTYLAADAESDSLDLTVMYSTDGGESFDVIRQQRIESQGAERSEEIELEPLANTPNAVVRIQLSDGTLSAWAETPSFEKWTPRASTSEGEHTAGRSSAEIEVIVIAAEQLTGHQYRVTFSTPDGTNKSYSVRDLNTDDVVLANVPLNGSESPVFHGIRLLIQDLNRAVVDTDSSGWSSESVMLGVAVTAPKVNIGGQSRQLLATPADYTLSIETDVVDTSATLFGFPAKDMRFLVTNESEGGRRDVLFADPNGNGYPDPGETLYIIEEDDNSQPFASWLLSFTGIAGTALPQPGDSFRLVTRKPITEEDVFEFVGAPGSVATESNELPDGFSLEQNYPNPFADKTTVSFTIPTSDDVRILLFDALGRRVTDLVDEPMSAGTHRLVVDGRDLPSGVYFYRLQTDAIVYTRKMLIVH